MIFIAHALDKPGRLQERLANIDAHRAYLDDAPARLGVKVLMSGPLIEDDGETMKGSFFLLASDSREAIGTLFNQDPMHSAGVWQELAINRVYVRQNEVGPLGNET